MILNVYTLAFALLGGPVVADTDTAHPAWPPAPDRARIRHLQTISSAADLQGSRGILDRFLGMLFGEQGSSPWLVQPVGIAVSASGLLAVADPGIHGVHIIDAEQKQYRLVTETGSGSFRSPVGVAFDDRGFLFVSDSELRAIAVFDDDMDPHQLITAGFERPTGVLCAGDVLYVVDTGAHRLARVDRGGRLLGTIGTRGTAGGTFNFPVQVTGAETLYVVDALNYRVQCLLPSGTFLSAFGSMGTGLGTFAGPKAIARDSQGHLYVTDALLDNVQVFDSAGRLLLVVGRRGPANGEFMSPGGIAVDRRDRVYVVDALNRRIQVFQYLP
jgi:DNA-binding beta-propeller fold protein YncE